MNAYTSRSGEAETWQASGKSVETRNEAPPALVQTTIRRFLPSQDASPIVEEFSVFDKKGDGNDTLVQMDSAMLLEEKQRGKIFGSTSSLMFRTFTRAGSRLLL